MKHNCPCCQIYGPIPKDEKLSAKERKAIAKSAKEAMDRFKKDDPEGFQRLALTLAKVSGKSKT